MKITELSKIKKTLKTQIVNNAETVGIESISRYQEVNLRIAVGESLWGYFTLANKTDDLKALKVIYICFAKYVNALPGAFFFAASPDSEKGDKQREKNKLFLGVVTDISDRTKNLDWVKSKESFSLILSADCVAVLKAFDAFRDTILKIN